MYENGTTLAKVRALTNILLADEKGASICSEGALRHFLDFEDMYYDIAKTLPITTREAARKFIKETKKKIGEKAPSTLPQKGSDENMLARGKFALFLLDHCTSSFYRDADYLTLQNLRWIADSLETLINSENYTATTEERQSLSWTYNQIDLYSSILTDEVTDIHMKYLMIQECALVEMIRAGIPSMMISSYWDEITNKYFVLADERGLKVNTFHDILGNPDRVCCDGFDDFTVDEKTSMEVYIHETEEDPTEECRNLRKIVTYCQSVKESIADNPFTDLLFMSGKGISHEDWYTYGAKFYEIISENIDTLSTEAEMRAVMHDQVHFIYKNVSLPVVGLSDNVIALLNNTLNIPTAFQKMFKRILERLSDTLTTYNTPILHLPVSADDLLVGAASSI